MVKDTTDGGGHNELSRRQGHQVQGPDMVVRENNIRHSPKAANFFHCLRFSPQFNIAFYRPLSMKFLDDFQVTVTF